MIMIILAIGIFLTVCLTIAHGVARKRFPDKKNSAAVAVKAMISVILAMSAIILLFSGNFSVYSCMTVLALAIMSAGDFLAGKNFIACFSIISLGYVIWSIAMFLGSSFHPLALAYVIPLGVVYALLRMKMSGTMKTVGGIYCLVLAAVGAGSLARLLCLGGLAAVFSAIGAAIFIATEAVFAFKIIPSCEEGFPDVQAGEGTVITGIFTVAKWMLILSIL